MNRLLLLVMLFVASFYQSSDALACFSKKSKIDSIGEELNRLQNNNDTLDQRLQNSTMALERARFERDSLDTIVCKITGAKLVPMRKSNIVELNFLRKELNYMGRYSIFETPGRCPLLIRENPTLPYNQTEKDSISKNIRGFLHVPDVWREYFVSCVQDSDFVRGDIYGRYIGMGFCNNYHLGFGEFRGKFLGNLYPPMEWGTSWLQLAMLDACTNPTILLITPNDTVEVPLIVPPLTDTVVLWDTLPPEPPDTVRLFETCTCDTTISKAVIGAWAGSFKPLKPDPFWNVFAGMNGALFWTKKKGFFGPQLGPAGMANGYYSQGIVHINDGFNEDTLTFYSWGVQAALGATLVLPFGINAITTSVYAGSQWDWCTDENGKDGYWSRQWTPLLIGSATYDRWKKKWDFAYWFTGTYSFDGENLRPKKLSTFAGNTLFINNDPATPKHHIGHGFRLFFWKTKEEIVDVRNWLDEIVGKDTISESRNVHIGIMARNMFIAEYDMSQEAALRLNFAKAFSYGIGFRFVNFGNFILSIEHRIFWDSILKRNNGHAIGVVFEKADSWRHVPEMYRK